MKTLLTAAAALGLISAAVPAVASPCATQAQAAQVRDYYGGTRPGAPLPIPGRRLSVPESVIASGLHPDQSLGTPGGVEAVKAVWATIDAWGPRTRVGLVFTSGGKHAFNFPSLVPQTQPTGDDQGFQDIYADDGKGVHGHLHRADITTIWATDLPGKEPGQRTRAVSFYGADGHLRLGVYASVAGNEADPAAVAGFARTWDAVKAMPRACAPDPHAGHD